jgi:hypothetical protein
MDISFYTHARFVELPRCNVVVALVSLLIYENDQHPTKAICPILLEDYRKITVERKGETNFFTSQMIKDCMKKGILSLSLPLPILLFIFFSSSLSRALHSALRLYSTLNTHQGLHTHTHARWVGDVVQRAVVGLNVHQTVQVDEELEIRAYYAGHVLGAAMFYVRVGDQSVVYTGDYNMTPDRHLGAAWIEKLRPDVRSAATLLQLSYKKADLPPPNSLALREGADHGVHVRDHDSRLQAVARARLPQTSALVRGEGWKGLLPSPSSFSTVR